MWRKLIFMNIDKIAILMDMSAALLALVSWESSYVLKVLGKVNDVRLWLFKGWKFLLSIILGVSVIVKCSADLASIVIIPMGFSGKDTAGLTDLFLGVMAFAVVSICFVIVVSVVTLVLQGVLRWFLIGNVQRKWVTTIAAIVFLSSCLKMYASVI